MTEKEEFSQMENVGENWNELEAQPLGSLSEVFAEEKYEVREDPSGGAEDTAEPYKPKTVKERLQYPREPLQMRDLPTYTHGEEVFNMVTHIVGGGLGVVMLLMMLIRSGIHHNWWSFAAAAIYAASMITCYTISSVYHGLRPNRPKKVHAKKVMQVLDHCDIYFLIAGTYTPVALAGMRTAFPKTAWATLGIVWGVCILGTVFTAIDFHKYGPLSYACYFVAGWSVISAFYAMWVSYSLAFVILMFVGGLAYTLGMIFFVRQTKGHKYAHSVFHLFILAGSILQFIPIFWWCM